MQLLSNLVLLLHTIRILQQLRMLFNDDFLNLALVCNDIESSMKGLGQVASFQLLE